MEHSKACCEFLKICYENDVIPNSCKVKLKAKPCPSDVIAKLRAQNIREASKKELELAIKTQELVTEDAVEKLERNLNRLSEKYPEEMLGPMVHKLNEKKRSQFLHFRNQFKKKFQFLKCKNCDIFFSFSLYTRGSNISSGYFSLNLFRFLSNFSTASSVTSS